MNFVKRFFCKPCVRRWGLNILGGGLVFLLLWVIQESTDAYGWVWKTYICNTARELKALPYASYDQRLTMKLGEDYQYLLFLREYTPEDAVLYYPSRADFQATPPGVESSPFSGKLIDKLSAIRVLYPRRVITEDEYGKTPWSDRLTHISIVGGCNLEKVPYKVPEDYTIGVLPLDSTLVKN